MKNIKKSKKVVALTLALGILATQSAFAAWSNFGTFSITNDETYYTTSGTMLPGGKTTSSAYFDVYASAKTMTSAPSVRLVNSSGASRSSYVSVSNTGTTYTGSNNTGVAGYNYYASVKPAWNQVGTDTIKLQHNPR